MSGSCCKWLLLEMPFVGHAVAAGLIVRIKFFQHPDLDEFKRDVLVPRFHKVSTEKPPESRKGAPKTCALQHDLTRRVERGILAMPGVQGRAGNWGARQMIR